jgi:hypothetical protein
LVAAEETLVENFSVLTQPTREHAGVVWSVSHRRIGSLSSETRRFFVTDALERVEEDELIELPSFQFASATVDAALVELIPPLNERGFGPTPAGLLLLGSAGPAELENGNWRQLEKKRGGSVVVFIECGIGLVFPREAHAAVRSLQADATTTLNITARVLEERFVVMDGFAAFAAESNAHYSFALAEPDGDLDALFVDFDPFG